MSGETGILHLSLVSDHPHSLPRPPLLSGKAILATQTVASLRSDDTMLCASHLAGELKGKTGEQWLAEKSDAEREEV